MKFINGIHVTEPMSLTPMNTYPTRRYRTDRIDGDGAAAATARRRAAVRPPASGCWVSRPARRGTAFALLLVALWTLCPDPAGAADAVPPAALWAALRSGGHIALLRHAEAPGVGDPADFRLEECRTQRNLSAAGRAQARRLGQQFRMQGVTSARVLSSRWCRCLETARLLDLGPVEPDPTLDSFFQQPDQGPPRTAALRRLVSAARDSPSRVLVTHQVNITALTGLVPQPGEMIVIRPGGPGGFTVVGRLKSD